MATTTALLAGAAATFSLTHCTTLLLLLLSCMLFMRMVRVSEESVTAIGGVGILVQSRRQIGVQRSRFIELAAIADVFVAEAVRLDRCHFYLALLLHSEGGSIEPQLVVPFQRLIPSLADLQSIHSGVRATLWTSGVPCTTRSSISSTLSVQAQGKTADHSACKPVRLRASR